MSLWSKPARVRVPELPGDPVLHARIDRLLLAGFHAVPQGWTPGVATALVRRAEGWVDSLVITPLGPDVLLRATDAGREIGSTGPLFGEIEWHHGGLAHLAEHALRSVPRGVGR